jgi:membrane-associated phospholipid phosphatase
MNALTTIAAPAKLTYDIRLDLPATLALGTWSLASELSLKDQLAPARCKWCGRNAVDDAARVIRAPLNARATAATVSDVLGIAAVPAVVLGLDAFLTWRGEGEWQDAALDMLLIIEAMTAAQALTQVVKFTTGRERPFVAALPEPEKATTLKPVDNNLSFYSGHTTYAFALVAAGATIARARGYAQWWLMLAAGAPLALSTALLRMVSDRHYLTDVLAGALLGGLIGWGLPTLFHRPVRVGPVEAVLAPSLGGAAVTGTW